MSPIKRFLDRHVDRALAWERHVTDALAVFDFDDDSSEPLEPAVSQFDRDFTAAIGVKL